MAAPSRRAQDLLMDDKWDLCVDLSLRRVVYSSLAGAATGLLFLPPTRMPPYVPLPRAVPLPLPPPPSHASPLSFPSLLVFPSRHPSESSTSRWAALAFGAGCGVGSAYTNCSRLLAHAQVVPSPHPPFLPLLPPFPLRQHFPLPSPRREPHESLGGACLWRRLRRRVVGSTAAGIEGGFLRRLGSASELPTPAALHSRRPDAAFPSFPSPLPRCCQSCSFFSCRPLSSLPSLPSILALSVLPFSDLFCPPILSQPLAFSVHVACRTRSE
ncbi:unnamed protein product [Closterium sp. Naga37s-1]|nr:unnamed protein product [Closterium sp. Naga37s-1]